MTKNKHIEYAVIDILTFALGMRPLLTRANLNALVKWHLSNA